MIKYVITYYDPITEKTMRYLNGASWDYKEEADKELSRIVRDNNRKNIVRTNWEVKEVKVKPINY